MKILITGGNGYIAKSLYTTLKDNYEVTAISREDFDLTSFQDLNKFFQGKYFDVVLHTAVSGGSRLREDVKRDMDINLIMYYNLLQHREYYGRFVHFGSGAEVYAKETPYGLSKYIIKESIQEQDNFFNIQIFGVFDENELDTRFIKSNIKRYINKEPMLIHADKRMTFFYMEDLVKVVKHTVNSPASKLLKEVSCSYIVDYSLKEIADIINQLGEYKVPVHITGTLEQDYIAELHAEYVLGYVGIKKGLQEVYNKLKS